MRITSVFRVSNIKFSLLGAIGAAKKERTIQELIDEYGTLDELLVGHVREVYPFIIEPSL